MKLEKKKTKKNIKTKKNQSKERIFSSSFFIKIILFLLFG